MNKKKATLVARGTQRFNTRLYADETPYNQDALGLPTRVFDNELNLVLRGVVTVAESARPCGRAETPAGTQSPDLPAGH